MVLKSLKNPFFELMTAGARKHHAQHRAEYRLTLDGVPEESDVAGQVKIIETSIARRDQILIITPADSRHHPGADQGDTERHAGDQSGQQAGRPRAGRPRRQHSFVGPSNFNGARGGDYALRALKPHSKVGVIEGLPGSINAKARSDGYREAIANAGMSLAGIAWGDWERDKGRAAATALLRQTPDLAALLCGNDNMAIGAAQALSELKRDGKVLIGGYDNIRKWPRCWRPNASTPPRTSTRRCRRSRQSGWAWNPSING